MSLPDFEEGNSLENMWTNLDINARFARLNEQNWCPPELQLDSMFGNKAYLLRWHGEWCKTSLVYSRSIGREERQKSGLADSYQYKMTKVDLKMQGV
jgi:hypothetical protein